jgi:hypothetical protein
MPRRTASSRDYALPCRRQHFEDICGELRLQDVLTVADDAQDLIANFATD